MVPFKISIFLNILMIICLSAGAQDNTPPERPFITYVTVDSTNNNILIYWTQSPSADVEKYRLYYETSLGGVLFDSVSAVQNSYIHTSGPAASASWIYSIAAVDSSGNASPREPFFHRSIFTTPEYDSCNHSMRISWNKYVGWDPHVSGYRIYVSENNAPYFLLNGLTASDSVYYHFGVVENTSYRYLVQAVKNDGLTSLSNQARKYTYMPGAPESMIAEYASVLEQNIVTLSFQVTDTSSINKYSLLRSGDKNADFILHKTISQTGSGNIIFRDSIITSRERFYYKLGALNSCNHIIKESNLASNIVLLGNAADDWAALSWNEYEEFTIGLQVYILFTKASGQDYLERARTGQGTTSYSDNITDLSGQTYGGELTYRVMAVEKDTEITALSNELTLSVNSDILLPNVFTPNDDGLNDVFLPVFSFIPEDYTLIIYDRHGIPIFTSKNPDIGWDGTAKGTKAGEGVYMYFIEYKSFTGKREKHLGHVTLFYPR